ncbi:MAG: LytR family transcriptional regulator [Chloroflexi bacterium]|nr:LytR family transcriptional regulator [Chloroflexota bacterium]
MRFSKRIRTRSLGPFAILGLVLGIGAGIIVVAFGFGLISRASARGGAQATVVVGIPSSAATVDISTAPPGTSTPTPWSLGQALTNLSLTLTPREPTNTPTPALRPTGYYAAPVDPTPIPTPILPEAAPFPESCDGPGRMNILIIGMDGRSGNYDRAARADALMVAGVNFGDRTAQILSIPRDLWVQIPEYNGNPLHENRINTAYALGQQYGYPGGGPAFQAFAISQAFGLRIDRSVVLNFTAFENAVDTIGGIDIDVPKAIRDEKYPDDFGGTLVLEIPAGQVHMDGRAALMYARTRHQDSDFGRMRRQQQVMLAVRDKLFSPEVIPVLPALTQLVYYSVRTDLSWDEVGLLGCAGPQISTDAITRVVIDSTMVEPFTAPSGAAVLRPKIDVILPALEAFSTGQ